MLVTWRNKCSLKPAEAQKNSFQQFPKTRTHSRSSFFVQESKQPKGTPRPLQESLNEIVQDLENQVHHYIRLAPSIRKFIHLEVDKFRAENVKTFAKLATNNQKFWSSWDCPRSYNSVCTIPPLTVKKNPKFTQTETDAIANEISKLLQKGVLKPSYHEGEEFISRVFVTPKSDGGYKLILNLKSLNEYIDIEDFKMHCLQEIMKLVEKNCYMAALDIKDAYYSIPVEESF